MVGETLVWQLYDSGNKPTLDKYYSFLIIDIWYGETYSILPSFYITDLSNVIAYWQHEGPAWLTLKQNQHVWYISQPSSKASRSHSCWLAVLNESWLNAEDKQSIDWLIDTDD